MVAARLGAWGARERYGIVVAAPDELCEDPDGDYLDALLRAFMLQPFGSVFLGRPEQRIANVIRHLNAPQAERKIHRTTISLAAKIVDLSLIDVNATQAATQAGNCGAGVPLVRPTPPQPPP